MADCLPPFNPEELARCKATVGVDDLFRWAQAIAGARGTLLGVNSAFMKQGLRQLEELVDEEKHLQEVMHEIVAQMKKGMDL